MSTTCKRCNDTGVIPTPGREYLAGTPLGTYETCPDCGGFYRVCIYRRAEARKRHPHIAGPNP